MEESQKHNEKKVTQENVQYGSIYLKFKTIEIKPYMIYGYIHR